MIVLAEYKGYRNAAPEWEDFAKSAIKPTVIIITSIGAITGVGIWFITSGVVPAAIGSMLRVFFWPWFIEWIVFALYTLHGITGKTKEKDTTFDSVLPILFLPVFPHF